MKNNIMIPVQYVVYKGDGEIIVTTPKNEKKTIKEFFGPDMGRDIATYDRYVTRDNGISVTAQIETDYMSEE